MYNSKLHFHFSGIGGSGMSGIAEVLINLGFTVSGSDIKASLVTRRLESLGATISIGHDAKNVPESASLLVYSSAISALNPEILEAQRRKLPVIRRAEVLAELMRLKFGVAVAGSHGKTTTTSMIAHIFERAGLDPTAIIGGQVKSLGDARSTGGRLGQGQFLVAETDESDKSFLLLRPTIAVVTNIDAEHMETYTSLGDLESAFEQFVNSVPFYGLSVLCIDDQAVRRLSERYSKRQVTYGLSPDAQIRAVEIEHNNLSMKFSVLRKSELTEPERLMEVELPIPGVHMVVNSLAAIAVALEVGISSTVIAKALASFQGVGRRLELVGNINGINVINDYAHHPTEIRASISALKAGITAGKLHVIFQPHRYTRTKSCFSEFLGAFIGADTLFVSDIYAASEEPIAGISAEVLFEALQHNNKFYLPNLEEIWPQLEKIVKPGDSIACLGAGSIGTIPDKILIALADRARAA